jgi:hypothetical protein
MGDDPNKTLKRDPNLDKTLYEDAERRRKENAQKKAELDRTRDMPKEKMYKNNKSDKHVMNKLDRELKQVFMEVIDTEEDS